MSPPSRRTYRYLRVRRALVIILLFVPALTAQLVIGRQSEKTSQSREQEKAEKKSDALPKTLPEQTRPRTVPAAKRASNLVVVQCIDGTTLRLKVLDERIELDTPYGKLSIPVRDIERIEAAFRIPEDVTRRIQSAIADLGNADFHRREIATAELRELRERAYPALLKASKSGDAEVKHRVRELLEKIRGEVPEERLQFRPHDVVYTAESKNTGRIAAATLKVLTSQFGEQQLKFSDVFELRSPTATEPEIANALPDPGTLSAQLGQIGKVYTFRVTAIVGPGNLWGTDVYSLDSTLALAAVHAGVLKPGQAGTVRVKILGPQASLAGSTRHGVTSQAYGAFPGSFEFVRGRAHSDR